MHAARLYAPSLVLLAWALVWQLGCRGDGVIALGVVLTTAAFAVHLYENRGRHHR